MATEIERKFLVHSGKWKPVTPGLLYRQGYLSSVKERVVRVRIAGKEAFFTVKGISEHFTRLEFEYPIPVADARIMLDKMCERPLVEKTRYRETLGKHTWEIDVFHGENDGLVLAEVEVASETELFERPSWLAEEVSGDPRYFNNNLVLHPFRTWGYKPGMLAS